MLSEFEYINIKKEVCYYCYKYNIQNINYNSDFIITNVLETYSSYINNITYKTNEKILCQIIKTISRREVIKYIFRNIDYQNCNNKQDDYIDLKSNYDKYIYKNICKTLNIIYYSLSTQEQVLFDYLSEGILTKNKICELLKISKDDYEKFIQKLKNILKRYL